MGSADEVIHTSIAKVYAMSPLLQRSLQHHLCCDGGGKGVARPLDDADPTSSASLILKGGVFVQVLRPSLFFPSVATARHPFFHLLLPHASP